MSTANKYAHSLTRVFVVGLFAAVSNFYDYFWTRLFWFGPSESDRALFWTIAVFEPWIFLTHLAREYFFNGLPADAVPQYVYRLEPGSDLLATVGWSFISAFLLLAIVRRLTTRFPGALWPVAVIFGVLVIAMVRVLIEGVTDSLLYPPQPV